MSEVQWEDPPKRVGTGKRAKMYPGVRERLQQQPGRWARLVVKPTRQTAADVASKINRRKAYPLLHGCEAVSGNVNGEHVVFVRWPVDGE